MAKCYWKDSSGCILIDSSGCYFYSEDCCCGGVDCVCCTGSINGFLLKISGVANDTCDGCTAINGEYCVPADDPVVEECEGTDVLTEHISCGGTPVDLELNWSIASISEDQCEFQGVWSAEVGGPGGGVTMVGQIPFDKGVACSSISGILEDDSTEEDGCNLLSAVFELLGLC